MASEFERTLLRELDYGREAGNLLTFIENFAGDETVHFPRLFEEFSTSRVLTMEFLEGTPVAKTEELAAKGVDLQEVARHGADVWIEMILRDGFFHADPHPGNILVLADDRIGVLDCGMTGRMNGKLRDDFENLLIALMRSDADDLTEALLGLSTAPPALDRDAFQADVGEFCADHLTGSFERFDFSKAIDDATAMVRRHRLILQSGLSQLLRTLALLEGTSRKLDRNFDLLGLIAPHAQRIALARMSPKRLAKNLFKRLRSWERLVDAAPDDLREILTRVRRGTFRVHLEHQRLNTAVNRGVQGILAGSIFLGSALLLAQRVPPLVKDLSIFGLAGVVVSVWLGMGLLRAIRHSGGLDRKGDD
jgi:ubiquinone biosynthesis protein